MMRIMGSNGTKQSRLSAVEMLRHATHPHHKGANNGDDSTWQWLHASNSMKGVAQISSGRKLQDTLGNVADHQGAIEVVGAVVVIR